MGFDASNFLLSLSDLFVIILPGFFMLAFGAIVLLGWTRAWSEGTKKSRGAGAWTIALVSSFLVGHFVSQFGALAEDMYWDARPVDIANEYPKMRATVVKLASATLSVGAEITPTNARRWAAVMLRQRGDNFGERIDRLDVERRFFRNMVIVFFIAAALALIVPGPKGKSKRSARAGLFILFSVACALSSMRYLYENRKFTQDIFENFIAPSVTAPASSELSVPARMKRETVSSTK